MRGQAFECAQRFNAHHYLVVGGACEQLGGQLLLLLLLLPGVRTDRQQVNARRDGVRVLEICRGT